MGAHVAFYLARRLRKRGCPQPRHLFVAACRAPQIPSRYPPLYHLAPERFLLEVENRYKSNASALLQDPAMLRILQRTLQADFSLFERIEYQEEAPLQFPVSGYRGEADNVVSREDIEGWSAQTIGAFRYVEVTGNHFLCVPRSIHCRSCLRPN